MIRTVTVTLLAGMTALPLAAQVRRERTEAPSRVRVFVQDTLVRFTDRRARLGVVVALEEKETDSLGAFIQSVSRDGPAARAGLRSGDIITRLDGQSVLSPTTRRGDRESQPGVRLIELAAKLEPNDTIAVEYLRGDARRTTTLVTGDEPINAWNWDTELPFTMRVSPEIMRGTEDIRLQELPRRMEIERSPMASFMFLNGLLDLEAAPLNSDLGWYFGTTDGVLIVRVPEDSPLGLRPGDVVVRVDGREPSSPGNLMRILRSYDAGDEIRFDVMRQKRQQTVTGRLPARDDER